MLLSRGLDARMVTVVAFNTKDSYQAATSRKKPNSVVTLSVFVVFNQFNDRHPWHIEKTRENSHSSTK